MQTRYSEEFKEQALSKVVQRGGRERPRNVETERNTDCNYKQRLDW